nr:MAG TPA: hypothetical protein [Bacteriophage sp.]
MGSNHRPSRCQRQLKSVFRNATLKILLNSLTFVSHLVHTNSLSSQLC